MKNKATTVFLLISVIGVWGWIAYKIHHTIADKPNTKYTVSNILSAKQNESKEYYTLYIHNRDPFLSILTDTATIQDTFVKKQSPPPITQKQIILPEFCGLIENKNNKTAILKFNKVYFFIKEHENFKDIKIQSINEDHIVITSNNENLTILLKKQ